MTSDWSTLESKYQLKTYAKYPLTLVRGRGAEVWTEEGRRFLDFYSGHAVALTGHCHPKVVAAIQNQASELLFFSNIVYSPVRAQAAEALVSLAPTGLTQVFFCNSGTEANEGALKMARKFTGRTKIIAMNGGFHGRTYGSMSITGYEKYRTFEPKLSGVEFVNFGDLSQAEAIFTKSPEAVAAIILEPIQSMAGVKIASCEYLKGLRQLCDKHGALLIFDEIQTALARTGNNFYAQTVAVTPDLITCAKGIASGVPMGAVLIRDSIAATIGLGEHGTTFGGGPLAAAALLATVNVIREESLCDRASSIGAYLKAKITEAKLSLVKEIRSCGLMFGLECTVPAKPLVSALLETGLIVGSSEDQNTLRLLPPLIISEAECDECVACLSEVLGKVQ